MPTPEDDFDAGLQAWESGDAAAAADAWESARAGFDDARDVADCDMNLGVAYRVLERYEEAEAAHLRARDYFEPHGSPDEIARCEQNLGVVYEATWRFAEAEAAHLRARGGFAATPSPRGVADCDKNLGIVRLRTGRHEEAEAATLQAKAWYSAHELSGEVADCDLNLGSIHRAAGRYPDAEEAYQRARDYYVVHGPTTAVADCDGNLGVVYRAMGRLAEAESAHLAALALVDAPGPSRRKADAERNLGAVYRAMGRFDAAEGAHRRARAQYTALGLHRAVAGCDHNLALILEERARQAGPAGQRADLLREALTLALPVAVLHDAYRFRLPSRRQREAWGRKVAGPSLRLALELARAVGDARLVAELILHARTAGSYALGGGGVADPFLDVALTAEASPYPGDATGPAARTASGSAAGLVGAEGYRLDPTPYLRTPHDTVALAEYVRMAEERYPTGEPLRRPVIVEPPGVTHGVDTE